LYVFILFLLIHYFLISTRIAVRDINLCSVAAVNTANITISRRFMSVKVWLKKTVAVWAYYWGCSIVYKYFTTIFGSK
jgi:hypothetical protein